MKKIYFLLTLILVNINVVMANDIKKIAMDIHILDNGDALVTEEWDASLDKGTEGYKSYYNLGNSTITNFIVYMNNQKFETLSNWDINASFNEKKYKAGINEVSGGSELCFGISEYGNNIYKFTYTITSFVSTLDDADMVYWTLIPSNLSDKPEYTYIKIYSDYDYSDDLPVWGYGNYGGYAYVYDGFIELSNDNGLDSDEYMTVLIKFPKGTYQTNSVLDHDFAYYLDMANEGSETYNEPKRNFLITIFSFLLEFAVPIIMFIIFAFVIRNQTNFGTKKIRTKLKKKELKEAPYFRDIPCNKDIFKAYWVSGEYGIVKNKTDFLGAILLKWLKNKNIENITVQSKILKKDSRAIKLLNKKGLNKREIELYDMMYESSGDGVLEKNEFTKWCNNHYSKILNWFNNIIDDQTEEYLKNNLVTINKKIISKDYYASDSLDREALQLSGLKNFLNEFSNIKDRESIEVMLWEYYLMYAQIFGIAKKVAKEFKDLYPDVITDDYYNDIIFIHTISYNGVNAASNAQTRAQSYSSGGGGFSSGGGGGGSFGGGGGGGFR